MNHRDTFDATETMLLQHQDALREHGWTVLEPELLRDDVPGTLRRFGVFIPQFNGLETYEVTYKPGFDALPYSQSKNGIGPHTEAPVYDPPPKYLALHCHRQAACGGGQTLLSDGFAFFKSLTPELQQWARTHPIAFSATTEPGSTQRRQHDAPMMREENGEPVFRFSYNLFRFGDVNPSESDMAAASAADDAGPLARIALQGEAFFLDNMISVLIPEGSVLIWDNRRLMHARSQYTDPVRHLTRYWIN
ncbi:TauD/TfdA family dioxygenase [Burkholderia sp. 22PA0106]|uniref:TauD/TfdA family dioxygenase n=1 Tax=Burkholderia sp. 22PA0106 TaxID=3237371 RepID=UPI0039C2DFCF